METYKILVETTNSKPIAQSRIDSLRRHNIDCTMVTFELGRQTFYSVQAGPFAYKKDALINVDKIKRIGVKNAFITNAAPG
ncbi:MAG: SPOR domain-containing protein [Tuberibacillus sp.]